VHRDLKPENLLLNKHYNIKIADFGLSTRKEGIYGTGLHFDCVGTRQYQAPEVIKNKSYCGKSVDIFAIGVILFVMVTGSLPYLVDASVDDPIYKYLQDNDIKGYWKAWHGYSRPTKLQSLKSILKETTFLGEIKEAIAITISNIITTISYFFTVFFSILVSLIKLNTPKFEPA